MPGVVIGSEPNVVAAQPVPVVERLIPIVLTDIPTPQTVTYHVQHGDTLGKIARMFNTTIESIMKGNHLSSHLIRVGQELRVWTAPLSIYIDKSDNTLIVKCSDQVIKLYRVATGAENITPVGEFTIDSRIKNPTWFKKGEAIPPGSPENALGTRWLGFNKPQYGIHGTIHPELIGQQVSHGCVRMHNEDVEELFDYIPIGTKVTIND